VNRYTIPAVAKPWKAVTHVWNTNNAIPSSLRRREEAGNLFVSYFKLDGIVGRMRCTDWPAVQGTAAKTGAGSVTPASQLRSMLLAAMSSSAATPPTSLTEGCPSAHLDQHLSILALRMTYLTCL
jgi:hypothetical protein